MTTPAPSGVSWRRYAAFAVPSLVAAGATIALLGQGALAASFAISGTSAKLSARQLEGEGFISYTQVDSTAAGNKAVTPGGFKTATLSGLCQSVVSPTPFGDVTLKLTAGDTEPVKATNLLADFDSLTGDITFTNWVGGIDAGSLEGSKGPKGQWGQAAEKISIKNLKQQTWATQAGSFQLTGLKIDVKFGKNECY